MSKKTKKQIRTIGIVGANLTALLLCKEAKKRGIETMLLDKEINNVASDYATTNIVADFDKFTLDRLALRVDAIIFTTNMQQGVSVFFDGSGNDVGRKNSSCFGVQRSIEVSENVLWHLI